MRAEMPWARILFVMEPRSVSELFNVRKYRQAFFLQQEIMRRDPLLYQNHWSLSWYALFAGEYDTAILAAQRTLELAPEAQGVETNLALGYLLNDQWTEAEAIYQKWKGRSFLNDGRLCDEIFLQDIVALEFAGITHPDFEKVRQLLAEDD